MATQTTNYNLSKPDASDPFSSFRASYNDNMDIIDANLGGGGGGSGHTIIDENDNPMTQRTGLHFEGNVEVTDDSVNDETNVNVPYEVVHLTQAQYDALPNTKLTDGKVYCITDIPAFGDNLVFPVCYSEEEREIGCWTDGKPLYQKTIDIGQLTQDTNWHYISHNISNVDKVVKVDAVMIVTSSGRAYPLMAYRPNQNQGVMISANDTEFQYMNNWQSNAHTVYITLQYTKTTDTAGSGSWTPTGVPSVHYSTDEQVIGTWMGEPLYQKTVYNSGSDITANSGAWTVICSESWVANVKTIISGNLARQGTVGDTLVTPVEFTVKNGEIKINPFRSTTYKANGYFTIQYTKT